LNGGRSKHLPVKAWVIRPSFADEPRDDPVYTRLWFGDEKFAPFIPEWMQEKLVSRGRVMRLSNGSTVTMKTWGQGWKLAQGYEVDLIMIDEECDDALFRELRIRCLRKANSQMIISLTGTSGYSWVQNLLDESMRGTGVVEVFQLSTEDNVHLDSVQREAMLADLDDAERSVRVQGGTLQKSAQVYRAWGEGNWREDHELPADGTDYVVVDHGMDQPTAALWIRVTKPEAREVNGQMVLMSDYWLHREYYRKGVSNIRVHVSGEDGKGGILGVNGSLRPVAYYIDPWSALHKVPTLGQSAATHQTVLELWRQAGLPVHEMRCDRTGWRVNRFLQTEPCVDLTNVAYPNIYALRSLTHFGQELRLYVWKRLMNLTQGRLQDSHAKDMRGPNHLIFCMEMALVMGNAVGYMPEATAAREYTPLGEKLSKRMWEGISRDMPLNVTGVASLI